MDIAWMAWTPQTGLLFGFIALCLLVMTLLAIYRPEAERVGVLRIPTTRGDRLFLSLLGSAFIHLAWLGLVGDPLWGGTLVSLAYAAGVFRFV
jgi:predicted small integral membrane protein